jgi:two-component system response regulator ChvI
MAQSSMSWSQPPDSPAVKPLIAIVEDEANLRGTLDQAVRGEGFATRLFADGLSAWRQFETAMPDLAILDIVMPRMDGLELCRRIRSVSADTPVLFLTSRDEEFDRVLGLELGADDYLCKPFSLRELLARVRVLLRRAGLPTGDRETAAAESLAAGALVMDAQRFAVTWRGSPLRLTVTEFRILSALGRKPGFVRSREELLSAAFPQDAYMSDRTVDCHIKRIRKKLLDADPGFDGIETIYGLGYRWREGA